MAVSYRPPGQPGTAASAPGMERLVRASGDNGRLLAAGGNSQCIYAKTVSRERTAYACKAEIPDLYEPVGSSGDDQTVRTFPGYGDSVQATA